MTRRTLSVLALAAAVLAVPPPSSPSAASPLCGDRRQYGRQPPRADRPAEAADLALGFSVESSGQDGKVSWVLALRNRTRQALGLYFWSSHYAHVVLSGPGVWYSWERRPAQNATWRMTLAPAETYVCRLIPDALPADLPAGRYGLKAYLNTGHTRVETRRSLIVAG